MGLVPGDLHGRNWAKVQALDERTVEKLGRKRRIFRDGGDDEARPNLLQHFTLWDPDDARVGAEELLVRQRVTEAVAEHDRRTQIDATAVIHLSRPLPVLRGHIL